MPDTHALLPQTNRLQRWSLLGGIGALGIGLVGGFFDPAQFFQSYLFGYLFWLQIALGCLTFLMLHHLAGGRWGFAIRRLLEAAAITLPMLAVMFVPLLFNLSSLYPWARPDVVSEDQLLQAKVPYLNQPFFIGRAILYLVIWAGLAYLLNRWSTQQDQSADPERLTRRFRAISSLGLILLGLTVSFAAMDWMMSLEPRWYSTMYGFIFISGALAAGIAFVILPAVILARREPLVTAVSPKLFNDLGNFLLAGVMFWVYIAFSQYLIIWSGNLPEEVPWYIHRSEGGWQGVVIFLTAFHFVIPFLLLLSRTVKRVAGLLLVIACLVIVARLVDLFWLVVPAFHPSVLVISWLDLVLPIGLGGIWLALFLRQLRQKPLLPKYDPQVEAETLEQAREGAPS